MPNEITVMDVFSARDSEEVGHRRADQWQKMGIAFVNRDESINVILDFLPLNGRFQLRKRSARLTEEAATRGAAPAGNPSEPKTCTGPDCGKVISGAAFERNQGVCNDCRAKRG